MDLLPLWYQFSIIFVFGLLIGSFLNVVMYRFHTGRSLSGHSHCLSCGTSLRWFELFPLLSYLALRGKCRSCGCHIPIRYFLLELATALLFLLIYIQFGISVLSGVTVLLGVILLMITVYDLYHMVIPDELVIAVGGLGLVHFALTHYTGFIWEDVLMHLLAAAGAFGFYGGLWFVSKGRWIGFGDAKLAIPLGFILGPMATFSFVVLSFWVGAAVSILILLLPRVRHIASYLSTAVWNLGRTCPQGSVVNSRRYFTMKSEVPFAPFMVIAFLLVYVCGVHVLDIMMRIG